ncbi:MAG: sugar ABC transporter ATP-binding protein [Spirochaetia bacterium]|nr:sugar ABC transporter ATP-binding protein [Spirochaetia bacterium]
MSSGKTLLELDEITKIYPGVTALDKVSIKVQEGEVRGLIGENGAGKSTLIKALAGAHAPTSGKIIFNGQSFSSLTPAKSMELGIACIYQELQQVPYMSVMENLFLGREIELQKGIINREKQLEVAVELLKEFNLHVDPRTELRKLGVGTRQMIEICKAVRTNAKLVIMDEPTAALSEKETSELFKIIGKLKQMGVTIIFISHRLAEIKSVCDSLTVLRDGCLVKDSIPISEVSIDQMVSMMVGHDIKQKYPKKTFTKGEPLLEVKGLTHKGVYHDVSFTAYAGELLGFAGLVGAGRTEVMRGVTGADLITSGEVFVRGQKVKIKNPKDSISAGIAFLTEDRKAQGLILLRSVEFNSTLVALPSYTKKGWLNVEKCRKDTEKAVKDMRIKVPKIDTLASSLSGGNQQKVVIAKWLLSHADIFIIDEPTRGIDVGAKIEVYNLINALLESGKAVIMVSSEMDECMGMADRIIVMHEGAITGKFARPEFTQEKIMYAASGLKAK